MELDLKWGVPKGWSGLSSEAVAALENYYSFGESTSAMRQPNTQEHKLALCELIDLFDDDKDTIFNDWDGKKMTKDEAKQYVINYK